MRYLHTLLLSFLISYSVVGQNSYSENENINNMATGMYYQQGPGTNNIAMGWQYPYGTKLTIKGQVARNFELMSINKDNSGYAVRQFNQTTDSWTSWRNLVLDDGNGNVGIGISNPNNPLSIKYNNGSTQIGLQRADGAENFQIGVNGTNGALFRNSSGGGDFDFQSNVGGGGVKSVLFVEGSNGNVGIGTSAPNAKLNIVNSGTIGLSNLSKSSLLLGTAESGIGLDANEIIAKGVDLHLGTITEDRDIHFKAGGTANRMIINGTSGFVGIGVDNPSNKLEVNGDISLVRSKKIKFLETVGGEDRAYIRSTNGGSEDHNSLIFAVGAGDEALFIKPSGNVGIGTSDPQNKLSVNGTIWATKVKVTLTDAADWVFEDDYNLRSLSEVENFIEENKHLPEIPSADEFRANDMEVSEMTNKLLQKIEELTLYTIAQEKEIKELQSVKVKNKELEARLQKIEALLSK